MAAPADIVQHIINIAQGRFVSESEVVTAADGALIAIGFLGLRPCSADGVGEWPQNIEDQMADGRMTFDYHLRPGTVTTSNTSTPVYRRRHETLNVL